MALSDVAEVEELSEPEFTDHADTVFKSKYWYECLKQ